MITKLAVRWLTWRLRKDNMFWYGYQSNIAMIIYDRLHKYYPHSADNVESPTFHEFCNVCANDFLKLWTRKD